MRLPLFPLSSVVLPDGILKLRLFERRYIDMVKACFRDGTGFGVCLIKSGNEAGTPSEPYPLGTEVEIVDFDQGEDGLLHIVTRGTHPFRVLSYAADDSMLLVGEVERLPAPEPVPMEPEFERLASKLELILRYVEPEIAYEDVRLDDADWVCHRLMELLPLGPEAKFELLSMDGNRERLETLAALQIEISDG